MLANVSLHFESAADGNTKRVSSMIGCFYDIIQLLIQYIRERNIKFVWIEVATWDEGLLALKIN